MRRYNLKLKKLWCEYLWVYQPLLAVGFGVLHQFFLEILSALGAILGLLRVSS